MENLYFYVFIIFMSVMCGMVSFVMGRKHLLNVLISLEYIVLSLSWLFAVSLSGLGGDLYFVPFLLTLGACEGALGLGLLVKVVRSHGSDTFSSFNSLQC